MHKFVFIFLAATLLLSGGFHTASAAEAPALSPIANVTIDEGDNTGWIAFTVSDADSPAAALLVTAFADDTSLVPSSNIELGGAGENRSIRVSPAPNASGKSRISVSVSDPGGLSSSQSFELVVSAVDTPPVISSLEDAEIFENTTYRASFVVFDAETAPAEIVLAGASSDTEVVPVQNVAFAGTSGERRIQVTPKLDAYGQTTITVTALDNSGQRVSTSFVLKVKRVNQPPVIDLPATTLRWASGNALLAIPFQVTDRESDSNDLQLWARSSDSSLVAPENLAVTGAGRYRSVRLRGDASRLGMTTLRIYARDPQGSLAVHRLQLYLVAPGAPASVANDFNADGGADLLFQHRDGYLAASFLQGPRTVASAFLDPIAPSSPSARLCGAADFDGDGSTDICLQYVTGEIEVWRMAGVRAIEKSVPFRINPQTGMEMVGAGDFSGDGRPDFLLQAPDDSLSVVVLSQSGPPTLMPVTPKPGGVGALAAAVGDFDRDGQADILWHQPDGRLRIWHMNGTSRRDTAIPEPQHPGDNGWRAVAVLDLNYDGYNDILFQHQDGTLSPWYMMDSRRIGVGVIDPSYPGDGWFAGGAAWRN